MGTLPEASPQKRSSNLGILDDSLERVGHFCYLSLSEKPLRLSGSMTGENKKGGPMCKERVNLARLTLVITLLMASTLGGAAVATSQATSSSNPPFVRAVWYTTDDPSRYSSRIMADDLAILKQKLCPTHILIKAVVYQEGKDSVDPQIDPQRTLSDDTLRQIVAQIHQLGMGVVFLPVLFVDDGTWEGAITPSDVDEWFSHWLDIVAHYADLAEETGIEILLIGSEMVTLRDYHDNWLRVIEAARQHYLGLLSYSANWWFDEALYRSVSDMQQWSELDYIGVTSYFELTDKTDPSLSELESAWRRNRHGRNVLDDLDRLSSRYGNKPIVFWEFGYQSKDGTNIEPWNFLREADPDPQEQADAYQAYFNVFSPFSWWSGQGIFAEQVGLPIDAFGYGVLGKPSELVIAQQACIP